MNNPHFTMPKVRILVADASNARLFRVESPTGDLIEMDAQTNPEARMQERELTDDKPGEQTSHAKDSRSAVDSPADPKDNQIQRFAREITDKLEKTHKDGDLEKLYVVAPPRFLGDLRNQMSASLKAVVVEEINKDFSKLNARDLRQQLPERLD